MTSSPAIVPFTMDGIDRLELRQELIDRRDRGGDIGIGIGPHRLNRLGGIVERRRDTLCRVHRRLRERGIVRRCRVLLQRAFQLGELGGGRLVEFRIVNRD